MHSSCTLGPALQTACNIGLSLQISWVSCMGSLDEKRERGVRLGEPTVYRCIKQPGVQTTCSDRHRMQDVGSYFIHPFTTMYRCRGVLYKEESPTWRPGRHLDGKCTFGNPTSNVPFEMVHPRCYIRDHTSFL